MKKSNKKILRVIVIFLIFDLILLTVAKEFVANNGLEIKLAEKKYASTHSTEDLLQISTLLLQTQRYNDIVKYYPLLLSVPELKTLIIKSSVLEEDIETLGIENVLNLYIFTYLDAVFELGGETSFEKEFEQYASMVTFTEQGNEIKTLGALQIFFFNSLGRYSTGIDKEKTNAFLTQINELWHKTQHTQHYNNYFYLFCCDWYSQINDLESNKKMHMKIKDAYIGEIKNEIVLPNNYLLGYSNEYGHNILGVKGYGISLFPKITEKISAVANDDRYILIDCTTIDEMKFYIVDTVLNTKISFSEERNFQLKLEELGLTQLEFERVGRNNTGDGSLC